MKKIMMILLALFLLGKMPAEMWNSGTSEQQKDFMNIIANEFAPTIGCREGTIYAIREGDEIYFIFECDKNEKPTTSKFTDT